VPERYEVEFMSETIKSRIEAVEEDAQTILFERLRECEQSFVFGEHIATQIKTLEYLAETYKQVASLEGSIGYRAFSVAWDMSKTLDAVIVRLQQMQQLSVLLNSIVNDK
jgi:hypothetical protein